MDNFSIGDKKAAERAFKWFLYSNVWAHKKLHPQKSIKEMKVETGKKIDETDIVRVFTIHFKDFKDIFDVKQGEKEREKAFSFLV